MFSQSQLLASLNLLLTRHFWLMLVLVLALILRVYPNLDQLVFPYDQTRDVFVLKQAWEQKDPILLGPVTDIRGLHHGPLYYYFVLPWYVLGNWQPALPVLAMIGWHLIGIVFTYALGKKLINPRVGLMAALLFAVSTEAIAYSRWLSNPVVILTLFPMFLYFFWEWLFERKNRAFIVGTLIGAMIQAELLMVYLLVVIPIWLWQRRVHWRQWMQAGLGFGLFLSPFLLVEVKFRGQQLKAVMEFLATEHGAGSFVGTLQQFAKLWGRLSQYNIVGMHPWLALVVAAGVILISLQLTKVRKYSLSIRYLLSFLLASLTLFFLGKSVAIFFLVGTGIILMLLFANVLDFLWRHKFQYLVVLCLIVIVGSQLWLHLQTTKQHLAYVFIQHDVLLDQRLKVIEQIFEQIDEDQPYTISVLGTPYGIRTAWSYYFWLYTQRHGGQLPDWYRFTANGYAGDWVMQPSDHPGIQHVTIYEPEFDVDEFTEAKFQVEQNQATKLIKTEVVHSHKIEFRKFNQ